MKGKIKGIYPEGLAKAYNYVCYGEKDGLFSFPIEWSYHFEIKSKGDPVAIRQPGIR